MSDTPQPPAPEPGLASSGVVDAADPAASANAEAASPTPGRNRLPSIPGYEVLDKLGAGGMGVVYKARHLALNRLVAIKLLNRIQQATEREILRLQMEGETVANLHHPNIVPLYQLGEFAGLPFLTFEYIDGGTLADRIAGRPQPPRQAAEMVELLARAVQLAHQQGVLHRDLKPANVLLSKEGVPKIADFGLARRLDYDQDSMELIAGTANYMSPEQAWGDSKAHPLTPATDVYSLGAILYELLTGRPPFASATQEETIKNVWSKAPAEPRSLAPEVPLDLQTICLKCLAKEPKRRYASAEALADDLRRWLDNEPIVARPTTRFERAVLWCRRDPVFAGVSAALVIAVLAGAIGGSWLALIYLGQRDKAEAAARAEGKAAAKARDNADRADKAAAEAKESAALANHARAIAELREADRNRAVVLLEASNDQLERQLYESLMLSTARDIELKDPKELADHLHRCPPRLRGIEWQIRLRQLQDSLLARPVTRHHGLAMAVSADGKWVATSATDNEQELKAEPVRVWSTDDWRQSASLGHQGQRLAFSPDGQLLVVDSRATGVEIWNWREHRLLRTFSRVVAPPEKDKLGFAIFRPVEGETAFSPDGRHFAIGLANTVQIYPVRDGEVKGSEIERTLSTGAVLALQYSSDNRRLVVLAYLNRSKDSPDAWKSELQIWDATIGAVIRRTPLEGTFKLMRLSPDGRQCAVTSYSYSALGPYEVRVYDLNGGQFRKFESRTEPQAICFSRDGRTLLLATRSRGLTGEGVAMVDVESLKLKSSPGSLLGREFLDVDSLPDGRIVGVDREGILRVWPRDGQSRLPHWYEGDASYALSRDGRELAVAQRDGAVRRFDLNDNRELPRLPAQEFAEAAGAGDTLPKHLEIANLCYSTNPGELLVVYSDLTARSWRLADQRVVASVDLACLAIETRPGPSPRHEPDLAHKSRFFSAGSILLSDDGKYAAWDGCLNYSPGGDLAPLVVWELPSGRIIVNENQRISPDPSFPLRYLAFATIGGRTWAALSKAQQPLRDPWRHALPLIAGWDLATGKRRSDSRLEQELRAARGPRVIDAIDTLTITSPVSDLVLLQLPLDSVALQAPRLSADRSRLAIATQRGIAVFDVGLPAEFAPPESGSASAQRATDKTAAGEVKWPHVDHAAIPDCKAQSARHGSLVATPGDV